MTEQTNLVPKRRFKGFQDAHAWKQCNFSEMATIRRGLTYKPSDVSRSGIRVLRSSNINEDTFELNSDDVFVKQDAVKIELVKENDILITSANGSSRLVGKHALINGIKTSMVHGGFMLLASASQPYFVNALMNSPWYHKFINVYVSGGNGAIGNLSKGNLESQVVYVPGIEEQIKIGDFFKQLDDIIASHQHRLKKTKALKSAYLYEMFPNEGELAPKRRFAGFTDDWEQRKLGDLMEISSASRVHKYEWTESGVPFFRSSDVVSKFKGTENNKAFISQSLFEKLSIKSGRVKKGDVLVTGGGSIGIPYLVKNDNPLYFKDADLIWLKNSETINGTFLYTFFTTSLFRNYVNSITHIGTISHYTIEQAKGTPIKIPTKEEQTKIGELFKRLDDTIALHQRKLEKLQNIKKAYLNEMFI